MFLKYKKFIFLKSKFSLAQWIQVQITAVLIKFKINQEIVICHLIFFLMILDGMDWWKNHCSGSVTFWHGSVHWITDMDPALFDSGFQDAKKWVFQVFSCLFLTVGTYFNTSLHHKTVEWWFTWKFLLADGRIRIRNVPEQSQRLHCNTPRYTNTCVLLPTSRRRLAQRKGWIMQMLATLRKEETLYFFYYSLIKAQIKSNGSECLRYGTVIVAFYWSLTWWWGSVPRVKYLAGCCPGSCPHASAAIKEI